MNSITKDKMYTTKGGAVSIGAGGTKGAMYQATKTKIQITTR